MKHISEILAKRQTELRQLSLFGSNSGEKGRGEWNTFNVIRGDRADAYRVSTPLKSQPRYPNVVHISRQPRRLTPKFGH